MPNAIGCDVSHYNPPRDWAALRGAVSFVGIKASEGVSNVDPALAQDQAGARGESFDLVWYYHVARVGDPRAQARRYVDLIGPLRPNERYCLDTERSSVVSVDYVEAWFDEVRQSAPDRQRLFYTSAGVCAGAGYPDDWALATEDIALVLPRYGSAREPQVPEAWRTLSKSWTIWQNSQTGRLPGIDGPVDLDVWNGDEDSLRAFAELAAE